MCNGELFFEVRERFFEEVMVVAHFFPTSIFIFKFVDVNFFEETGKLSYYVR